jgi:hypothetical protein
MLAICLAEAGALQAAKLATEEADVFRKMFFALTFFSIGPCSAAVSAFDLWRMSAAWARL